MKPSETTLVINYVLNVFVRNKQLQRAIVEPKIKLNDKKISNPDLLCLITSTVGKRYYLIFEIKSLTKLPSSSIQRIEKQHQRYTQIRTTNLDRNVVPIIVGTEFQVIYFFAKSDKQVLRELIYTNCLAKTTSLLFYSEELDELEAEKEFKMNEVTELLVRSVKDRMYQTLSLLPFTMSDLVDIRGGEGETVSIGLNFNLKVSLSHVFAFIFERVLSKKPSQFHTNEIVDYVEKPNEGILRFGDEEKKALRKKLRLLVYAIEQVTSDNKIPLLEKIPDKNNQFRLLTRNSRNLHNRLQNLEGRIFKFLDEEQRQEKLDRYFSEE